MKPFATRLRTLRERRQLSQTDLAKLLGIHPIQISRYERGMALPSVETVGHLARALQVTTDELILGGPRSTEPPEIRNAMLLERFRKLDEEIDDRKDVDTIVTLIDAFLSRKQLKRMAASA